MIYGEDGKNIMESDKNENNAKHMETDSIWSLSNNTDQDNITLCQEKIAELLIKYNNNEYIKNKLTNHILNQLTGMLDQADINHIRREERKQQLESDQFEFTNRFLNKNNYFYMTNTEIFFHYDGKHYKTYREDDILHEILTRITCEQNLMSWKHKIKLNIIKLIRERSIFKSIPESQTIQSVLGIIYPAIFSTKNEAKYFLTIIGDNLLRKNDSLIYLINHSAKNLLKTISDAAYNYFNNSVILNCFKYKYHEQHKYEDCRLINYDCKLNRSFFSQEFSQNLLDLLCVSVYYSNRYSSADDYLVHCGDLDLVNYSLYLRNSTPEIIIDNFIEKSLQKTAHYNSTTLNTWSPKINTKKMFYLWRMFLKDNNLPHVLFLNTFKNILKTKLTYDEETDNFKNITSVYLPAISKFISFWDENMCEDEEDNELEIEEIVCLFRHWSKNQITIRENFILDLIKYFYSDVLIDNNKYILHIKCKLWDKREKIYKFLADYRNWAAEKEDKYAVSISNLYIKYCKLSKKDIGIVSKYYFEKRVRENLVNFIDAENMITPTWWQNVELE